MSGEFNILITAASRRVAMIRGFTQALEDLGVAGRVLVCDSDRLSPGLRFADKFHLVPLSSEPEYIPTLLEICRKENIKLVVPTIDEELPVFGKHKKDFAAIGVTALVSDERVGLICNDKYKTSLFFAENGFPFAKTMLPEQLDFKSVKYPLFIKPRSGRGSVDAYPVKNEEELKFFLNYVHNPVVQNFLTGKEYTIDVLAGLDGRIIHVVPRERIVIRSGVSDRARTRKDEKLMNLCAKICGTLGVVGPVNIQCKIDNGKTTFFEINPRFSGAIQLTTAAGADFFRLIVQDAMGLKPEPAIGDFKDNFLMISYEESIFESNGVKKLPAVEKMKAGG
ncbi:MAG: ATP-grasp domain-containing protein [Nitrospinae bacterium]|nr:ATP-grasp domain-containing protein [Nitrospinota bacterium]